LRPIVEVRGQITGRVWHYDLTVDRIEGAGSGERYRATAEDDGSFAYVHRVEKGGMWEDEVDRTRHAIAIARLPAIVAAPTIRRLLDSNETSAGTGEFDPPAWLTTVWEWADLSLDDFLHSPDGDPGEVADAVEVNVGAAFDVLHGVGLIHCDIAPNNVLRVDGQWKLADLDACVRRGEPAVRQHVGQFYVHPDRHSDVPPARDEFDHYGLQRILERLRRLDTRD
jgi:hypothetical protein